MDCVHYELARCCIAMSWAKVLQMLISLWIKRRYPEKIGKALSSSCWSTFLGVTLLFPCFIPILCYIQIYDNILFYCILIYYAVINLSVIFYTTQNEQYNKKGMTLFLAPIFYALFKGVWDPEIDGYNVSLSWCFYLTIFSSILQFVFVGLLVWRSMFCDMARVSENLQLGDSSNYISMDKKKNVDVQTREKDEKDKKTEKELW